MGLPITILATYAACSLVTSLITAILYWRDKRAARLGFPRTPERTLLAWSLAGGWPGALIASRMLRHKTQKTSYRVRWFACVVVNALAIAGVAWWAR